MRFTPALTGVVWEWQTFLGGNDAEVAPNDPTMYTLEFLADGSVAVRADCNQGRGTYTTEGAQLTISRLATTRVACPPESLSDRYVRDLQAVVTFVFREGRLALDLPADAGQLIFAARALEPLEATPVAG